MTLPAPALRTHADDGGAVRAHREMRIACEPRAGERHRRAEGLAGRRGLRGHDAAALQPHRQLRAVGLDGELDLRRDPGAGQPVLHAEPDAVQRRLRGAWSDDPRPAAATRRAGRSSAARRRTRDRRSSGRRDRRRHRRRRPPPRGAAGPCSPSGATRRRSGPPRPRTSRPASRRCPSTSPGGRCRRAGGRSGGPCRISARWALPSCRTKPTAKRPSLLAATVGPNDWPDRVALPTGPHEAAGAEAGTAAVAASATATAGRASRCRRMPVERATDAGVAAAPASRRPATRCQGSTKSRPAIWRTRPRATRG